MPNATTPGKPPSLLDSLPTDLFGSDIFVDYQGTYVWQANQVGHIALGFAGMSVCAWAIRALSDAGQATAIACWFALGLIVLYAGKELVDLLIAQRQALDFYAYDRGELRLDMAADTWFVASGVLLALAGYWSPCAGLIMAGVVVIGFLVLRRIYLPSKESLDRTALPYLFRLTNFPATEGVHRFNADRIRAFVTGAECRGFKPPPAILVQGYRGTGKTTLGIGIGCEAALRRTSRGQYAKALYITAFGLFEREAEEGQGTPRTIRRRKPWMLGTGDPWSVEEAEYLVIDDVDNASALYGGATPEAIVDHIKGIPDLYDLLRDKRTVWVTGTDEFEEKDKAGFWETWCKALCTLYGCTTEPDRAGCAPADIEAREPIPVIWLRQPLEANG